MEYQLRLADLIQIGILFTLFATLIFIGRQSAFQSRLLKAQLLRDRFETYFKMYEPVSDGQIAEFRRMPIDFIDAGSYKEGYQDDDEKVKKYFSLLKIYEYLAFSHGLEVLGLPDPLGYNWTHRWTRDLIGDRIFLEVHRYHGAYYPNFAGLVDELARASSRDDPSPTATE